MATAAKKTKSAKSPAKAPATPATPAWTAAPPPKPQPAAVATPTTAAAPYAHAAQVPPAQPMQSGMLKAGTILLLIGAIMHMIGAFFLIIFSVFMIGLGSAFEDDSGEVLFPVLFGLFYLLFGVVLAVGGFFGFSAWKQAKANQLHSAWIRGLVSSLLPPLQLITLLGAIFILVSPEHDAQERAKQQWGGPR